MKRTIEEVRNIVFELSNGECTLVSEQYQNNRIPMIFMCRCGETFTRCFYDVEHKKKFLCNNCRKKEIQLNWGDNYSNRKRYSIDDIKKEISKKGYTMLDESQYINTRSRIDCICSNGHIFELNLRGFLNGNGGCKFCKNNSVKGENNTNYSNGCSKTRENLRKALKPWKKEILKLYDNQCPITHTSEEVEVHHLTSMATIIKRAERKTGIKLKDFLNEYDDYEDYYRLKKCILEENNKCNAIAISKKIHRDFHKKYGQTKITNQKQFDEYLQKEYGISLKQVLKKR